MRGRVEGGSRVRGRVEGGSRLTGMDEELRERGKKKNYSLGEQVLPE